MKIIGEPQHVPFGPFLAKMHIDADFCTRLLKVGKTLIKKHNPYLAGNIHHEYAFDLKKDAWIKEEFKVAVNTWLTGFKQFSGDHQFRPTYRLHPLWINFQKPGEYNPIHTHPNCNLSMILFLEIPNEILEEKHITKGTPPGHTGFIYGEDTPGGFITHQIIRPEANVLYMFPSGLRHYVSHFNSKVTRTSVSGNIMFDQ